MSDNTREDPPPVEDLIIDLALRLDGSEEDIKTLKGLVGRWKRKRQKAAGRVQGIIIGAVGASVFWLAVKMMFAVASH